MGKLSPRLNFKKKIKLSSKPLSITAEMKIDYFFYTNLNISIVKQYSLLSDHEVNQLEAN
jgi:hypothetical protein